MSRTAVIAGVGPGLGASIAERFAAEGCSVALLARSESYLDSLADRLRDETPGDAAAVPTDLTDSGDIEAAFEQIRERFGQVDILVNHASAASWDGLLEQDSEDFRQALAVGPEAALHCSQEAVSDMVAGDGGTVIFTGATTSVRGREGAVGFSAAKFACRGLAESMARELGPEGVHVAHVVIDGGILPPGSDPDNSEEYLDPDAIADNYWHLVEQDRSAWTLELDLRPHVEEF
jgi:NAD(P)-dependent dehydrogenase (short-subunit alcohol dehydrogenase family)